MADLNHPDVVASDPADAELVARLRRLAEDIYEGDNDALRGKPPLNLIRSFRQAADRIEALSRQPDQVVGPNKLIEPSADMRERVEEILNKAIAKPHDSSFGAVEHVMLLLAEATMRERERCAVLAEGPAEQHRSIAADLVSPPLAVTEQILNSTAETLDNFAAATRKGDDVGEPQKFVSPEPAPEGYDREVLVILVEEAAEVQQRATKALRFGVEEVQPGQKLTNRERLGRELGDLIEMVDIAIRAGLVSAADIAAGRETKRQKIVRFLQNDRPRSTGNGLPLDGYGNGT